MLAEKKILLGVCGSIAAYKVAFLTRLLVKAGAQVRILMTSEATRFISPLTLSTLSGNPVLSQVSTEEGWNNHVELGLWADAYLIAPCTANTLAKMAQGFCDNMVTAAYLSARCTTFVAPAMDMDMWSHPATQRNLSLLENDQVKVVPVGDGDLASGLSGPGRMAEPEQLVDILEQFFNAGPDLKNYRVLVTAGPTYEDLDPVRYIGNRSSGKMGITIAQALVSAGAEVDLVMGPSSVNVKEHPSLNVLNVKSAEEMAEQCLRLWPRSNAAILAAAVADYTPQQVSSEKIKKKDDELMVRLTRTRDIAATLGERKTKTQVLIGFALETEKEEQSAREKLERKNFDMIVLNSLNDQGAGFAHDTNKVSFLYPARPMERFPLKAKTEVAADIVERVSELLNAQK